MSKPDTKQWIRITSLLLFLVVFAVWALFYFVISNYIADSTKNQMTLAANKIIERLGNEFSHAEKILYDITQNGEVKNLLHDDNPNTSIPLAGRIAGAMGASVFKPDFFEHIIVYQSDSVFYRLMGRLPNKSCLWLYDRLSSMDLPNHIAIDLDGKNYLGYADNISLDSGYGIATILIEEEKILDVLQAYDQSGSLLVAIRAGGEIVAANTDKTLVFSESSQTVVHSRIGITPYEIMVTAQPEYLNSSVKHFTTVAIITGIIFAIALFVYSDALNRRFFRPMVKVVSSIENLDAEISTETLPHVQSEEFDGLIDKINEMLLNIDTKNNEIKYAELRAKNAEIERQKFLVFSLKKQINAHFTINTLEVMRLLAERGDIEKAETAAAGLIALFRYAYDKDERINIWDEYEVMEKYIEIMNIRYDGKLEADFDFDDRLMKYYMPRMLLQPILENSVVHGFAGKSLNCKISVAAKQRGNLINFTIADNGRGMSKTKLAALRDRLKFDPEDGQGVENIALVNIQNRLHNTYGGAGGMEIASIENKGFEVSVSLPIMEEMEGI